MHFNMIATILIILAVILLYVVPAIVGESYWMATTNISCDWYVKNCVLALIPFVNIVVAFKVFKLMAEY